MPGPLTASTANMPKSKSRAKPDLESQPAAKKRKLDLPSGSQSEFKSSFADVLEKLKEGTGEKSDTEGGADCWSRPSLTSLKESRDKIVFQQIDVEDNYEGYRPVIRMYGVTETGHSVLAHVHDFLPYFYVAQPRAFQEEDLEAFRQYLNSSTSDQAVLKAEIVKKRTLWGYRGDAMVPFIKLTLSNPKWVPKVRDKSPFCLREISKPERDAFTPRQVGDSYPTFESNIKFTLRFMIDTKVVGMNWIEVPAGKYKLVPPDKKKSHCQIEIDLKWDDFISHEPEGEWSKIAPLRILSFDIECAGRKGVFPEASKDPVIQIANMVTRQGEKQPFVRNVFTLNTCSHIVGSQVLSFDDEAEMLVAWKDFVEEVDPDLVIGYNISNFDFPYLMERAEALKAKKFPYLGRIKNLQTKTKDTHFSSKAYGQRDSKETVLDGRLQLDVLQFMQREHKLRSYSLNSVCAQFLGEQKEDVHHSIITDLQNGTSESRRRLAIYCLKDAYLPQRLLDKLMCFVNYIEMARVTGVPFNYLLSRGQSIKVLTQLFRRANDEGYLIPALKGEGTDEQYEGATVIEPNKGFYDVPIATLDFSSLYPSIMMAHNLCYTTLLDKPTIERMNLVKDVDYLQTPNNDYFATTRRRKGLLPIILEDLIAARKRAKADLKNEKDPFKRAVLDGRQLALKISANSVYGFTGATVGKLPCLPISSSVTAYGRQMIEKTKQASVKEVEAEYSIANGHEHDAKVIYGDTDSVMVRFGPTDLKTVMALGSQAADFVTAKFVKPIKLEFEKVYFPYLLISKKRYAGLYWTHPEKYDKMDAKGIETVRRDNCRLVSTVIETCLHKMLIDRDVPAAEAYVKQTIANLLQNKVDMSQLVITKALAKSDYAAKQAHVELAERMKQRDAGSAPALGDRVAYVIVKGMKGAAAYEKSEDPLFVLENNIPIDTRYYLDNQLAKPLMRIFEPILGDKSSGLLSGDHTRTIQIATPTVGGLMKFAVKTITCLGCKTPLRANNSLNKDGAVCKNCRPRMAELYQKQVTQASELQVRFSRLWTQCQRCQGSLHQDVLCSSKDCPIFYMRKKAQKDVEDANTYHYRLQASRTNSVLYILIFILPLIPRRHIQQCAVHSAPIATSVWKSTDKLGGLDWEQTPELQLDFSFTLRIGAYKKNSSASNSQLDGAKYAPRLVFLLQECSNNVGLSLAQQIAQLETPAPEFSAEDFTNATRGDGDSTTQDDFGARDHYLDVGESTLRKLQDNMADPKYDGVRTSRRQLMEEDVSSDENDGLHEDEDSAEDVAVNGEASEEDDEDEDEDPSTSEHESDDEQVDQSEEQNHSTNTTLAGHADEKNATTEAEGLTSALRKTREEDRKKGLAVSRQIDIWDGLLDARIRIQKASVASQRLPIGQWSKLRESPECQESLLRMLKEATLLSEELSSLQEILAPKDSASPPPRKRRRTEKSESVSDYEVQLQDASESVSAFEHVYHRYLTQTLNRWSAKIQAVAPSVLLPTNRNAFSKDRNQIKSAVQLIDENLSEHAKLLSRTHVWRGKGARLGTTSQAEEKDEDIFDDTDFYQQLLRDVIDSRDASGASDWMMAQKERKAKKKVDTKASKGRKLRYEVHDKLRNFMVPITVRGAWHEEQIDELFASVLGKGFEKPSEGDVNGTRDTMQADSDKLEGFRLFG
ncbi:DNA-directed DNA polymerase delta [Marasmius crinis-equi]|uniref:DNA polymerase n=1 Tax=Marasmius crinis-equi TaxID=585013 RepID=A0ABR3FYH6_9AGAR